jgi:hypothetical protein
VLVIRVFLVTCRGASLSMYMSMDESNSNVAIVCSAHVLHDHEILLFQDKSRAKLHHISYEIQLSRRRRDQLQYPLTLLLLHFK